MRRKIACYAFYSLFLMTSLVNAATFQSGFVSSQRFYSVYPEQKLLAEQLESIVSRPPAPLNIRIDKTIRIVIVLSGPETSLRNRALLSTFKQRMRELRIDYRLDVYTESDQSSLEGGMASHNKIAQIQPDYLVMTHTGPWQFRSTEQFLRQGRPKVIYYNLSTPLKNWQLHPPLLYLGFDEAKTAQELAQRLHAILPMGTKMDAFVLPPSYLGHYRCNAFIDQMTNLGHTFRRIVEVDDDAAHSYQAAKQALLAPADFIFSCTQNISNGVVLAINEASSAVFTKTNSWGEAVQTRTSHVVINTINRRDELTIALVEAIKLDLLGRRVPQLVLGKVAYFDGNDQPLFSMQVQSDGNRYSESVWMR